MILSDSEINLIHKQIAKLEKKKGPLLNKLYFFNNEIVILKNKLTEHAEINALLPKHNPSPREVELRKLLATYNNYLGAMENKMSNYHKQKVTKYRDEINKELGELIASRK